MAQVNPVPAVNLPAQNQPVVATTTQPLPTTARRAMGTRTSLPIRVAYTRHATAGSGDDRIVHPIVVVLAWAGGVALLCWVLFGGFQWGRAKSSSGGVSSVVVTSPAPQVIVVSQPPVTPSVTNQLLPPQQSLTDAEQRNEALKEKLRRRYGIQ